MSSQLGCRYLIAGIVLFMSMFPAASMARSFDDIMESGYISVAVYNDFPPYSFKQGDEPKGIDVDVAKEVAKQLELDIRWMWITADENLEDDMRNAIWKGHIITREKADLMMRVPYDRKFSYAIDGYGLPKNEMVVMFGPYHRESWAILKDTKKTNNIDTLAIFQYEKIAVEIDSLPSFFLGATIGGRLRDNIIHSKDIFEAIDLLKKQEVAAVSGMRSQLEWGMPDIEPRFTINAAGLAAISIKSWDIGMAVQQDFRQLAYAIEDQITLMVDDKRMQSIFDSYGITFEPASLYQQSK
ncbi:MULTISPECIES: transporter substrate-binding domain-containing protein [Aliiglaciecola]|uniref:transporter substrate-binding domain-containing protein n=1 Tax=Aliiglaciecola TaxID=1406885 RepID=UPI001C0A426D|nr:MULTISPECIES: transporter substrate-binding domain-containing protein [Aliiglaciecola]MBU2878427.1 transporter substrate-binding domain-containing protein [Aliiglaciecola lipolytica]MDO6711755.1 transporter substrate-binding domain-containing protein [Aliiglaciecola sp. 2_MG-2023]MDO6752826.1 transporter substrate-binding domain-containing protein [Aliiglaciecola sp. 1_MG-2023]